MSALPILYSAHHCSSNFGEFANRSALTELQRKRLSDIGTDRTVPLHGKISPLLASYSRGVVDLNRSPTHLDLFREVDFADPPNRIWHPWQEPTNAEQEDILRRIYQPYHDRMLSCLRELSRDCRPILVVAWDNMGRYPMFEDGSKRPGETVPVILSNGGAGGSADREPWQKEATTCYPPLLRELAEELRQALRMNGFPLEVENGIHFNVPDFKGGYICKHYTTFRHPELPVDASVQSLQVEYDAALTHNLHTLEANNDAIVRLQRAFSTAMERTYQNLLPHFVGSSITELRISPPPRGEG